ncbi:MAG TPA: bifunctional hydroxymethylpyrimidine kinase/phosphomethylpyrimidine kinase [Chthoniobacterales bacterium]
MQNADTSDHIPAPVSGNFQTPPVALTIAGSDNSAGAGIQADLKTFTHFGVYGLTAVTCVVAEVPGKVTAIQPIEPRILEDQVRLSLDAFPVAAIKTGMLFSVEIIEAILRILDQRGASIPLVVDPVMVATSGSKLLQDNAIAAYEEKLIPRATLVTPNLDEAAVLLGEAIRSLDDMERAGRKLAEKFRTSFLMKGGHLPGGVAVDLLVESGGLVTRLEGPFVSGVDTHGSGCTYSSAITANLAHGYSLREAVSLSKSFMNQAIQRSFSWQHPHSGKVMALNHFQHEAAPSASHAEPPA